MIFQIVQLTRKGEIIDSREEVLKGVKITPDLGECIWVGKPVLLPYLFGDRGLLRTTIILGYLIIVAPSPLAIKVSLSLFYIFLFTKAIFEYVRRKYYITPRNLIVKLGRKFYYFPTEELIELEFKIDGTFYDRIFNCKPVQYGRYYGNSEGDNNIWSEKSKFRCIKDYDFVIDYIKIHTSK